jgi:magnesium-transporting ATPase (P-type)
VIKTGLQTEKGKLINSIVFPTADTNLFSLDIIKFFSFFSIFSLLTFGISLFFQIYNDTSLFNKIIKPLGNIVFKFKKL